MKRAGIALASAAIISAACATGAAGTASGVSGGTTSRAARAAPAPPSIQRIRTIAFDNTYGVTGSLPVYVRVDAGTVYPLTARCDAMTCSLTLVLLNGPHEVAIAVEQDGRRSQSTVLSLDTTNVP